MFSSPGGIIGARAGDWWGRRTCVCLRAAVGGQSASPRRVLSRGVDLCNGRTDASRTSSMFIWQALHRWWGKPVLCLSPSHSESQGVRNKWPPLADTDLLDFPFHLRLLPGVGCTWSHFNLEALIDDMICRGKVDIAIKPSQLKAADLPSPLCQRDGGAA